MPVDRDAVRRIAALARLGMPEDELDSLAAELDAILGWVAQLSEVDTASVAPMAVVAPAAPHGRDDRVTEGEIAGDILANAPQVRDGMFAVPKVIA